MRFFDVLVGLVERRAAWIIGLIPPL
jgi:hypothetical protein